MTRSHPNGFTVSAWLTSAGGVGCRQACVEWYCENCDNEKQRDIRCN